MVRSRRGRSAAILAVAAILATACGGSPDVEPTETETQTPTPTEVESTEPPQLAPLTGLPVDDDVDLDRPAMAVKIENTSSARPQAGLEVADVVYEELVEGGVTRFIALYHSQIPEVAGPIRSARLVDIDVLVPFRPLLVYSGARPDVTNALIRTGLIALLPDDGQPVFYRDPERSRSHDLFAYGDRALEKGSTYDEVGTFESPFVFDEDPPRGGESIDALEVRMSGFSQTGWEWDDTVGVFRRLQDGRPHEVVDGEIGAANVVVVLTDIGPGSCCDTAGNPFVATRMTGGGDAVVLRDGRRYDVRWNKDAVSQHLTIERANGDVFPFAPGPTWILLAPANALPDDDDA